MHETFMNTLRRFFTPEGFFGFAGGSLGAGKMRVLALVLFGLAVIGLAMWACPPYRRWFRRMASAGAARSIAVAVPAALFKLLLVFMVVRFLAVAMAYQSSVFCHEHGRITERNREAVVMKWGTPHEQRELGVGFTRKRTWVTRQLRITDDDGKHFVTSESYWKDEEKPVQPIDGELPLVLTTHEEEREVAVEQRAIRQVDVEIKVRSNPRTLGGANYAGYDDEWELSYAVANEQKEAVTAHFEFPRAFDLDQLRIVTGGADMIEKLRTIRGTVLAWDFDMPPGLKMGVDISFRGRGLEHLRYIPQRGVPTAHYRVAMTVEGVPAREFDYPWGSMPAEETLADLGDGPYTLHWTLDNAITTRDIGIKLPVARQPKYHIAVLLDEAPTGLLLLLVLLVVPRLALACAVRPSVVVILSVAYYLFYTFLGRLVDVDMPFAAAFAVAVAVLTGLVAFFRSRGGDGRFLAIQDVVVFAALAVLYPLAVIHEKAGLWMQVLYIATLLYVCVLVVHRLVTRRDADEAPAAGAA